MPQHSSLTTIAINIDVLPLCLLEREGVSQNCLVPKTRARFSKALDFRIEKWNVVFLDLDSLTADGFPGLGGGQSLA